MMQSNPMAFSFIFCLSIIFDSEWTLELLPPIVKLLTILRSFLSM
jgi:hypothetical protein